MFDRAADSLAADRGRRSGARGWRDALLAVTVAALVVTGCSGTDAAPKSERVVTVLGSWEGPELDTFEAVVAPFEARTGITVEYTATRDLKGVITRGLEAGHPPDVAGLPGPAFMFDLAASRHLLDLGQAIDLGTYKRETAPAFVEMGTIDDRLVGVFIKATVKGLLWYDPHIYDLGSPTTWSELLHMATQQADDHGTREWCVGLASGATSGWSGTDWIEDFLLRQSGPATYDAWISGELPWDSPAVRSAFQSYGQVVAEGAVRGGVEGALRTYFADAGDPLFQTPPGCIFLHQGSFMTSFLDDVADPPPAYDFIPFPDIDSRWRDSLIGAGDLFGMLRDTPEARALIAYLVTQEAQSIWVARGGALSGNFEVQDYPTDIARREAALLSRATVFRFDASDSMPEDMSAAFLQAVLDFTADQSRLDEVLTQLDDVREVAYPR